MIQVAAAVIIKEGQCLITRRAPGQNFAGLWEFPGGKLEPGETAEFCLQRELAEELSIHISVGRLIAESHYQYPKFRIHLLAYHAVWESGNIQLSVHDAYAWADSGSLLTYHYPAADEPILRALIQDGWLK